MITRCPSCQTSYRVDPGRLKSGRARLRCARCGVIFHVESPPAAAPPPARPPAQPRPAARSARDAGHRAAEALSAARAQQGTRLVVALVAGEAGSFRQTLVSALARCGVRTITLDDGPAAMETARLARPRLLIVQAYLRGLCGVELIPELRSDPLLAGCRILLYGAPAPAGRWLAPPERVYGADAHVGEDIAPEALDRLLRCLLGLPGGAPPPPPDDGEMRAACRVAISDLVAADGEALDAGLRDGRFAADLTDHIELIRDWCVDRFPAPDRRSATVLTVFEEELQLALARRAPDVGAALTT